MNFVAIYAVYSSPYPVSSDVKAKVAALGRPAGGTPSRISARPCVLFVPSYC